jgi:hypothetical protein
VFYPLASFLGADLQFHRWSPLLRNPAMANETTYYEDDDFLITNKRLVLLDKGRTIPITDITDQRFEEEPLQWHSAGGIGIGFIDGLFGLGDH